jgi:hypothetical protein
MDHANCSSHSTNSDHGEQSLSQVVDLTYSPIG